jgi:drug/metabolite transporter (DMT)-like permease
MAVTLAGVAWVVSEQPNGHEHAHTRDERRRGALLALLAAAAQAVALVLSKMGIGDCDPMAATTISMFGALAGFAALVTIRRRWSFMLAATTKVQVMALLVVGVILGPFVGVATQMIAIRHASTGVVATIIATMPVLILPFSIFLHRERASLRAVVGAILAVVGVGLLMWPG